MQDVVYGRRCKNRKLFENQSIVCKCKYCHATRARMAVKNPFFPPSGEGHPAWKGGLPICTKCGRRCASYESTGLCKDCRRVSVPKGMANPNWVGGERKCLDCGIDLKKPKSKRCKQCSVKWRRGENHHLWKGGRTSPSRKERNQRKTKVWADAVRTRDRFICQSCGTKDEALDAHHKKRWSKYPELRFDINNGIALCRDCHLNVAHRGNWNRDPVDLWL